MKNLTNLHRMFLLQRVEKTNEPTLKRIKNAGVSSICLDKDLLVSGASTGYIERENKELIERIHELEMLVFAYTFKNELFSTDWQAVNRRSLLSFSSSSLASAGLRSLWR